MASAEASKLALGILLLMTVTLVATVGASNANSYLSLAAADAIAATMLQTKGWNDATTDEKSKALIAATRYLDQLEWIGSKTDPTQALLWPRVDASCGEKSYATDVIPEEVKYATFDLADSLLINPSLVTASPAGSNELIPGIPNADLKSASVDVIRVEFKSTGSPAQINALNALPHLVGVLGCLCLSKPLSSVGRVAVLRS
jgi:hypothetical protein